MLGVVYADESDAAHAAPSVDSALRCQRHRGPDETGTWADGRVVFGFNRLGFIDLENSHQPLTWGPPETPDRYTLNFNGEVYNYRALREDLTQRFGTRFRTDGDGEAVVAAYHHLGEAAVEALRGMFVYLIWDSHEQILVGGRDAFGIKPLFCAQGPRGVAFSSEKKSLLELAPSLGLDLELDPVALQHYAVLQYVPEPETLHRDIRRVESGTTFRVGPDGTIENRRYYHPRFVSCPATADLPTRIRDVLRDSVAHHMISDPGVTVGAFLSGGIDSTATTALAKEINPNLVAFTAAFERDGYSEVDVAAESAAAIGVEHVVRTVSPEEMIEVLPLIVWYLDDPVADPALVPLWFVAREARRRVKAVLSGEGADELFGGYTIYHEPLSLAPFERMPPALRRAMGRLARRLPEGLRGRDLLRRGALPLEERYYGNARNFREDTLRTILRTYSPEVGAREVTAPWFSLSQGWDPIARMQHVDLYTWLRGDILVKADKVTMANSLELRVPFLDREVFEVAATIPPEQKIAAGTTKYALRRALEPVIPSHVLHRPKLGFPVPIRDWLRDEMYPWARGVIAESGTDGLLNRAAVSALLEEHRSGRHDRSRQLWTVLMFMLWHGIFVEDRIAPKVPEPEYPVRA